MTAPARPARITTLATLTLVVTLMPVFVLASSAGLARVDLGLDEGTLGLMTAAYFASSAGSGPLGGRAAERYGPRHVMRVAVAIAAAALLLVPAVVTGPGALLAVMTFAGLANGMGMPAVTLSVAQGIRVRRGLMLGVQQSGPPMATMLAGAAVPLVGVTIGWQWSFVLAAVLAAAVALAIPAGPGATRPATQVPGIGDAATGPLVGLAVAIAVGAATVTSLTAFLVPFAASNGLTAAGAGWLLTAGSVAGIVIRLGAGWYSDHLPRGHLLITAGMFAIGSVGFGLLSHGGPVPLVLGGMLAFACGWGWPGVLLYAVIRASPNSPASGYGIVHIGAAGGAAAGPILFGLAAEYVSYASAWLGAATAAIVAAALVVVSRRWLIADLTSRAARQ